MNPQEIHDATRALIDKWCERKAISLLGRLLPGYFCLNGLTDGYAHLEEAIKDVLAFCRDELPAEEKGELKRILVAVQGIVYRQ